MAGSQRSPTWNLPSCCNPVMYRQIICEDCEALIQIGRMGHKPFLWATLWWSNTLYAQSRMDHIAIRNEATRGWWSMWVTIAQLTVSPISYISLTQFSFYRDIWLLNFTNKGKPSKHYKRIPHMTGLLHEGIFHVEGVLKPAIFGGMPRAHMMCNWAQILICWRHWPTE